MASQSNKKPKLVRDSFTIPKAEFAAIDTLKTRAIALGTSVKKSELLRAGLMALQGLSDAAFKAALSAVPTLKTGRPTGADSTPEAANASVPQPAVKRAVPAPSRPVAKPAKKAAARPVATKAAVKPAAKKAAAPTKKAAAPARKMAA